ncbi:CAP domain-containing protein [Desulfotomaculum defluvii]
MKKSIKLFSSMILGVVAFVLAVAAPGAGSAEAYVSYNNTQSSSPNYKVYNTSYQGYNYSYKQPTTSQPTYNKPSYNYSQPNYNQYNYTKPSYNTGANTGSNTGSNQTPGSGVVASEEQAMLNLINKERAAAGLKPLTMDAALTQIARTKAKDMVDNNYFSHTSPTYGSPFDMMKNSGVVYHYAGENLAGAADVNTAHTNLMNSPGHRANILKPEYTKVGIGVVSGSKYGKIYVQEFNG